MLFDEPLTVIDPHLKWQLRRKLKQMHHELKLTMIYVTHDQTEALTFADQVVVMTRGERGADRHAANCSSARATPSSATSSARRA
jgi:ABC-type sugar transport system ATPase subunit